MLMCMGNRADLASNGLEALRLLACLPYDIVLLDMEMAEMDGLGVTRIIRESWPPEEQPYIIALAERSLEYCREACLKAGANSVIFKPLKSEELKSAINSHKKSRHKKSQ